jgi:hypothetical protein
MNLLVALETGTPGEELLASVRVVSHVSGWPVRVVHVKASRDAPDLELPARLRTNTDIHELVGDPADAILEAVGDDDVLAFGLGGAAGRVAAPQDRKSVV